MSRNTRTKVLLSLAALGAAGGIAGLGSYAAFTSTTSASNTIASGTVSIALGAVGADNRLTIGASGLVPGDSLQRRVKLTNAGGNEDLASIVLTTTATTSSLLDTDATDGLKMKIQRCAGGTWTEGGTAPAYTYTCSGTATDVLARTAIIGSFSTASALSGLTALNDGSTDDLVVTVDLPSTTGNGLQAKTSTIQYSFVGTQRAGGVK